MGWRAPFWAVAAIGILAFVILAVLVPATSHGKASMGSLKDEVNVLRNGQVLIGLVTTVLGFAGVFAFFTYIQPVLTEISGFSEDSISPILLVFGLGLAAGNVGGGKLADWNVKVALVASLALLILVLLILSAALHNQIATLVLIAVLGVSAFATLAPLQLRVLDKAGPTGQNLASSLNIAAFNLGNAIGAWLGGQTIDAGAGLAAVPITAATITAAGLMFAVISVVTDRSPRVARDIAG
jgi:DHA1 family inner membrane transport protein